MKRAIYTLAFALLITGTTLVSCKQTTEEETIEANTDESEGTSVMVKSTTQNKEWEAFKISTDSTINRNEMRIAELKVRMKDSKKTIDSSYQNKVIQLEEKNQEMKMKLDNYKNDANENWDSFKTELNYDMNELGNALKDLTVDNKK
ncbi:hypothetical protein HNP99_000987 [Flavobacterium sp. 28A]|uniref:hypothetical protein n=1 Tax=Flavobacterium sp. 28A TaxID=2735895 RepID=UPI0015709F51|nr:hypothetical protein [Flavobacterium sp. 28A]NRT14643.1 hypothetical protein [Flavobacterium sp. 28A]